MKKIELDGRFWNSLRFRLIVALALAFLVAGTIMGIALYLKQEEGSKSVREDPISHYTCPMHPQIKQDTPGDCPICHMDLVPVYKPGMGPGKGSGEAGDRPDDEGEGKNAGGDEEHAVSVADAPGAVHISSRSQQLIGVRTVEAQEQKIVHSIHTSGRVAFDPELAIAIREYLQVARRSPSLRRAAESRLRLLGMGEEELRDLRRGKNPYRGLYLPGEGSSTWIYATVFEHELPFVAPGAKATITIQADHSRLEGTVRSLSPLVDPKTRTINARIQVPTESRYLRPDTYVQVTIHADLGRGLMIPLSSMIDTGTEQIVYVKKGDHFAPRRIQTGIETDDMVHVRSGLQEGEKIVSRAAFMVDSESRLKAPVEGKYD